MPWCITLDNSNGISRLRFWAKNSRVNGINDLPVFVHQGIVLAEVIAQFIEARTDLRVERYPNLGGTMICHEALVSGELDLYVEYSGTALTAILNLEMPESSDDVWAIVTEEYRERFDLEWLEPLGFNNSYTIAVRRDDARRRGWASISDLARDASHLRAGFTAEFAERADGYRGLSRKYGFEFAEVHDLEPALMYTALARKELDAIAAFATDGRIDAYDLQTLKDDASYFPPYQAPHRWLDARSSNAGPSSVGSSQI